ncbi:MAG: hypothetical protein IT547_12450 [Hyphomonadaceae bacterium]|jgi:hypothetical protein|nr:hypothetical protein [Hyphomonadaceae bacterium]
MFRNWSSLAAATLICACSSVPEAPPASIGVATMSAERVITLQLRATSSGGAVGDALLTYAPGDPNYADVLTHLGGLEPGETKPVPPWPD